ncbi:hypothetical protein RCL_jg9803.t2 [Rhizophagus clarus]|uniref:Uncharacterized protein n=1 Tax=Rhizophagus clarus TaxID=94130 RepID=A0A8H3M0Q8_9GLOM|nr:hypothetical protein RCL_jg9803.t2 [Rhizophagus clarus]
MIYFDDGGSIGVNLIETFKSCNNVTTFFTLQVRHAEAYIGESELINGGIVKIFEFILYCHIEICEMGGGKNILIGVLTKVPELKKQDRNTIRHEPKKWNIIRSDLRSEPKTRIKN